ncbi:MAG: 1-(5-phosphoribosyl)-5-[(5-phosphoribosylamino)methylideneamino]imidazole-4-carboxamide isomerase [Thermoproteota archaeon]|nr:MAG: 1-(5-phosphoribosyl)-5-[(5-phosphoribosylamino)methylideneamino]imidazole-4-carboxamide isomerase [Candidatus Korarchaeota archaeon]
MLVIPSIDLMRGKVVRLKHGDPSTVKVYSSSPLATAQELLEHGAKLIHAVDLDAAMGLGSNREVIAELAQAGIPLQVGGGVRSVEEAAALLAQGVQRVVVGTIAVRSPLLIPRLIEEAGGDRVAVAIDYRGGKVALEGWRKLAAKSPIALALELEKLGVRWAILTSVERDGALSGPDLDTIALLKRASRLRVVASGGVASLRDIASLREAGADGVILGRAIYEGLITLREAMEVAGCL